jgi:hypothetical protein
VVKYKQQLGFPAYKKKHSSNHQKFFFYVNTHDFDELNSLNGLLAPPLLKGRATREKHIFPVLEPNQSI